jgi:serine/threonine-protein kinase
MTGVSEARPGEEDLHDLGSQQSSDVLVDITRRDARLTVRVDQPGADPLIGRVISDRYKILATIARGGMGKVYRAEQAPLGRLVALKVLTVGYGGEHDPDFHKRFFREASVAAKLKHPNTVTIFDYGRTEDNIFYIAMELLEGQTLQRVLRDERSLSAERTVHLASQICGALREAHALGVVHRDLKPANVYIVKHGDETEFAKVLDFGLVKETGENSEQLTQTGMFLGSPRYMSPEQIQSRRIDGRVDIYALGVMMYEMLAGLVPFNSENTVEILLAHVNEPIPAMQQRNPAARVPAALESLVRRCMAKSPHDRFDSMNDVLTALKQCSLASVAVKPIGLPQFFGIGLSRSEPAAAIRASVRALASVPPHAPTMPRFAQATQESSRTAVLLLAIGLVLVGIGGFFALSSPSERRAPEQLESSPVSAPVSAPVSVPVSVPSEVPAASETSSPAASQDATVLISLRSSPPGAMVAVADAEYGPTPIELEWSGPDALPGRQVTFRFRRTGYRAVIVTREIRGKRLKVEATFQDPLQTSAPPRLE